MKIAYVYDVIHPYVIGGAQKRIWEIATRLVQRGHEVTLFGMKHWDGNEVIHEQGVRLWGVCPPQELYADSHRSIGEALSFARRLTVPLMKERYDVVDAVNFPFFPCFPAALHTLIRRSRLFITWHEVWDSYWYEYLGHKGIFGRAVERLVVAMPHQAIAVSPSTAAGLRKLGRKRAHIIPNGVDPATIESTPPSGQHSDILYAGRLTREKNVALLIEAIGLLSEHRPEIRCVIIGDGPERPTLQKRVFDLGISRNVHFMGRLQRDSDVFSHMKCSKALVLPSLREGFGMVVVEANACGIPVVTVNHPLNAARDLVTPGRNGFVCNQEPAAMADSIMAVLNNDGDWAASCREYASQYGWDAIVDLVEQLYYSP